MRDNLPLKDPGVFVTKLSCFIIITCVRELASTWVDCTPHTAGKREISHSVNRTLNMPILRMTESSVEGSGSLESSTESSSSDLLPWSRNVGHDITAAPLERDIKCHLPSFRLRNMESRTVIIEQLIRFSDRMIVDGHDRSPTRGGL